MQVRVALRTLFTKAERYLLRNNKAFVLHSGSDSSDSTDDGRKDEGITKYLKDKNVRNTPFFDTLMRGALKQPPCVKIINSPFHSSALDDETLQIVVGMNQVNSG